MAKVDLSAKKPPHCPFCAASLQDTAFYADEVYLAVYNIAPVLPGHSLVLPRAHVESVLDLDDPDLGRFMLFARRVTRLVGRAFAADGFDWTIQDGCSAGQSVPHLHLHVIPRHLGDMPDPGDWYPALVANEGAPLDGVARPRLTPAEYAEVSEQLRTLAEREYGG